MAKPKGLAAPMVDGFAESLERVRAGRQLPPEQPDELIPSETGTLAAVPGAAPPAVKAKVDQSSGHASTTVRLSQAAADGLWDAWVYWSRSTEPWLRQTELVSRYVMEGIARDLGQLGLSSFPVAPKRPKRSTK